MTLEEAIQNKANLEKQGKIDEKYYYILGYIQALKDHKYKDEIIKEKDEETYSNWGKIER